MWGIGGRKNIRLPVCFSTAFKKIPLDFYRPESLPPVKYRLNEVRGILYEGKKSVVYI